MSTENVTLIAGEPDDYTGIGLIIASAAVGLIFAVGIIILVLVCGYTCGICSRDPSAREQSGTGSTTEPRNDHAGESESKRENERDDVFHFVSMEIIDGIFGY